MEYILFNETAQHNADILIDRTINKAVATLDGTRNPLSYISFSFSCNEYITVPVTIHPSNAMIDEANAYFQSQMENYTSKLGAKYTLAIHAMMPEDCYNPENDCSYTPNILSVSVIVSRNTAYVENIRESIESIFEHTLNNPTPIGITRPDPLVHMEFIRFKTEEERTAFEEEFFKQYREILSRRDLEGCFKQLSEIVLNISGDQQQAGFTQNAPMEYATTINIEFYAGRTKAAQKHRYHHVASVNNAAREGDDNE